MFNLFNFSKKEENVNNTAKLQAWSNALSEVQSKLDSEIQSNWYNSDARFNYEQQKRNELKQTQDYQKLMNDLEKVLFPQQLKLL